MENESGGGSFADAELVEGVGNEVLYLLTICLCLLIPISILLWKNWHRAFEAVHPSQRRLVDEARRRLGFAPELDSGGDAGDAGPSSGDTALPPLPTYDSDVCPICLQSFRFAVQANCGHMFCGECITTYWTYGQWVGAINCPVCRGLITILLPCFREADPNEPGRAQIAQSIHAYNRRFSGAPRSIRDYISDIPVLLPHLWSQFFSMNGLILVFRFRVVMCLVFALVYLLSPLDVVPEAVFGFIGVLDDIFVIVLLAIYLSMAYRRFIAQDQT